jgi:L-alanine-DL-glutamate epimerase-like enolase superfamily enzyme
MLEFPCDMRFHLKLADDLVEEPLEIRDGFLYPKGPGLGIKLDEGKLKKYTVELG